MLNAVECVVCVCVGGFREKGRELCKANCSDRRSRRIRRQDGRRRSNRTTREEKKTKEKQISSGQHSALPGMFFWNVPVCVCTTSFLNFVLHHDERGLIFTNDHRKDLFCCPRANVNS